MSVSSMTRTKDSKAVYVLFEDGDKKAEIALPDCRFVNKYRTDSCILHGKLRDRVYLSKRRKKMLFKSIDP